jgi:hypothetical protein
VSTFNGARRYTSASCGVAQSTTVVVTAPASIAGISVKQSPTCKSNQFFGCGMGEVARTTVVVAAAEDVEGGALP